MAASRNTANTRRRPASRSGRSTKPPKARRRILSWAETRKLAIKKGIPANRRPELFIELFRRNLITPQEAIAVEMDFLNKRWHVELPDNTAKGLNTGRISMKSVTQIPWGSGRHVPLKEFEALKSEAVAHISAWFEESKKAQK